MDNLSTPKSVNLQPSFFLTPPDSSERENSFDCERSACLLPPPPQPIFLSSILTPPKETPYPNEDVVSKLYESGYPRLSATVFNFLQPGDLASCVSVCRTWKKIIRNNKTLIDSVRQHRKQQRTNSENTHKQPSLSLQTGPLIDHTNYLPLPSPTHPSPITVPSRSHRPCPNCSSPARVEENNAVCSKCNLTSCTECLQLAHTGECSERLSSTKKTSTIVAGTKKSKRRLKRL